MCKFQSNFDNIFKVFFSSTYLGSEYSNPAAGRTIRDGDAFGEIDK